MLPGELSCAGAELFVTTDTAPLHRLWSKIRELKLTRRAPRWHSAVIVTPVETFSRKSCAGLFVRTQLCSSCEPLESSTSSVELRSDCHNVWLMEEAQRRIWSSVLFTSCDNQEQLLKKQLVTYTDQIAVDKWSLGLNIWHLEICRHLSLSQ